MLQQHVFGLSKALPPGVRRHHVFLSRSANSPSGNRFAGCLRSRVH